MINTRKDLKRTLSIDSEYYIRPTLKGRLLDIIFYRERIVVSVQK